MTETQKAFTLGVILQVILVVLVIPLIPIVIDLG
jgi:hypothetical protein